MKRRLMILGFLLLTTGMLALPGEAAAVFTFCETCGQNCWNEANTGENSEAWWRCRDNGGSETYCNKTVTETYYNGCVSMVCNYGAGCRLPLM